MAYYRQIHKELHGPYQSSEIQMFVNLGAMSTSDLVFDDNTNAWVPISDLNFFDSSSSPTPSQIIKPVVPLAKPEPQAPAAMEPDNPAFGPFENIPWHRRASSNLILMGGGLLFPPLLIWAGVNYFTGTVYQPGRDLMGRLLPVRNYMKFIPIPILCLQLVVGIWLISHLIWGTTDTVPSQGPDDAPLPMTDLPDPRQRPAPQAYSRTRYNEAVKAAHAKVENIDDHFTSNFNRNVNALNEYNSIVRPYAENYNNAQTRSSKRVVVLEVELKIRQLSQQLNLISSTTTPEFRTQLNKHADLLDLLAKTLGRFDSENIKNLIKREEETERNIRKAASDHKTNLIQKTLNDLNRLDLSGCPNGYRKAIDDYKSIINELDSAFKFGTISRRNALIDNLEDMTVTIQTLSDKDWD